CREVAGAEEAVSVFGPLAHAVTLEQPDSAEAFGLPDAVALSHLVGSQAALLADAIEEVLVQHGLPLAVDRGLRDLRAPGHLPPETGILPCRQQLLGLPA